MKTKLLLIIFVLGIYSSVNAQVIDLIGKGVIGNTSSNLPLTNVNTIDHVEVYAIYAGRFNSPSDPTAVTFSGSLETPTTSFNTDIINKGAVPDPINGAYYTATFNNVDDTGVNIAISDAYKTYIQSFYAFVYRNVPGATYKSFISSEIGFVYQNGSLDPIVYNIPIETASASRNVTVKIPLTELDATTRKVVIDIVAGSVTKYIEVETYNLGNSLFIGEYLLENVPGNVNNISVSFYSPGANEGSGDSVYINGVVADVDIVEEEEGCTLTQGYWKTHSSCKAKGPARDDTWDALPSAESTEFFLSNQDYCEVFATKPAKGGKYYILAHQYIAAQLNMLGGTSGSSVSSTYSEATDFLNLYTPADVSNSQTLQAKSVELGAILDDYNNGIIGPGHCTDGEEEARIYAQDIVVAPNPISSFAKISLTADRDGDVIVNLYDSHGAMISPLYNNFVYKEEKISINLNVGAYANGMYYVKIWNGNISVTKTIIIEH